MPPSAAQPTSNTYSSYTCTAPQGDVGHGHYVGFAQSAITNPNYDTSLIDNSHRDSSVSNTLLPSSSMSNWNNTQNTQILNNPPSHLSNNQYYQQSQQAHIATQTLWNIAPQLQQHQQHAVKYPTSNYYQHLQFPEIQKNDLIFANQQPDASNLPCLDLNSTELEMLAQTNTVTVKPEGEISAVENMTDSFNLLSTFGI